MQGDMQAVFLRLFRMYFLYVVSDVCINSCIKAKCSPSQFSCALMVVCACPQ